MAYSLPKPLLFPVSGDSVPGLRFGEAIFIYPFLAYQAIESRPRQSVQF
jgi:hypothetical protein